MLSLEAEVLMAEAKYVYFVSSYERGDAFSEVVLMEDSLEAAVKDIVEDVGNWTDGIYTHAIIWRVAYGNLFDDVTEIVGIYAIRRNVWLDYEIEESERRNGRVRRVLAFSKYEIVLGYGHRCGPGLTTEYVKHQMVASTPVDVDGKLHNLHKTDDGEAKDIGRSDFVASLSRTDG